MSKSKIRKILRAYKYTLTPPENLIVVVFFFKPQKLVVCSLIPVEGGKALSRLLNDKIPNIW